MCDVIKILLKRRDATRSGKGNQPLNIKTAVEQPTLKLGLPNFRPLSNASKFCQLLIATISESQLSKENNQKKKKRIK